MSVVTSQRWQRLAVSCPVGIARALGLGVGLALALGVVGCRVSGTGHAAAPPPLAPPSLDVQPVVAEAVLTDWVAAGHSYGYFLPGRVHGHPVTLLLDTGTSESMFLFAERLANLGIAVPTVAPRQETTLVLDSITWGPRTERRIPVSVMRGYPMLPSLDPPPGFPPVIGIVGQPLVSHYDLLFDAPAKRARFYPYTTPASGDGGDDAGAQTVSRVASGRTSGGLPAGMTAADCVPLGITPGMAHLDDNPQHLQLVINGQPVEAFFDSGFLYEDSTLVGTYGAGGELDDTTATLVGVNAHSPGTVVQEDSSALVSLPLWIGAQRLTIPSAHLSHKYDARYHGRPFLQLGLLPFRDRRLLVSYSTSRFCVSSPVLARSSIRPHHLIT